IIGKYGNGRLAVGPDQPPFADYLFWFHFANGSFMPRSLIARTAGESENLYARMFRERRDEAWRLVEQRLGEAPYFAGEAFTAADIIMVYTLTTTRLYFAVDMQPFPNI